jgi:hypothetical protein
MRSFFFLFFFFTHLSILYSQLLPFYDFPPFEKVSNHFYKNYKTDSLLHPGEQIFFEKKAEGYFVVPGDSEGKYRRRPFLLWSSEKAGFESLPIERDTARKDAEGLKLIDPQYTNWQAYNFDCCLYYGYPNWEMDVIQTLEGIDDLPDTLLYGLGRAYTTYSTNLLTGVYDGTPRDYRFDLPSGSNALESWQLEEYLLYHGKACDIYLKLHRQSPEFMTMVGPVFARYSNEVMDGFLKLLYFQNEEVARSLLQEGLYSPFTLRTARNMLTSCPPNAVLITQSDNDTYPLLYVQAMENFRTDVLVMNYYMLSTGRYVNAFRQGLFGAEPVNWTIPAGFYSQTTLRAFKLDITRRDPLSFEEALNWVQNTQNYSPGGYFAFFPVYKVYLPLDKMMLQLKKAVPKEREEQVPEKLEIYLGEKEFYLADLVLLDLVGSLNWNRPICFSLTGSRHLRRMFGWHWELEGLVYRLVPSEQRYPIGYLPGDLRPEVCREIFLKKLDYGEELLRDSDRAYYLWYQLAFQQIAEALTIDGHIPEAIFVLDELIKRFPNRRLTFGRSATWIVEQYFQLGERDKAEEIGCLIWENIQPEEKGAEFIKGRLKSLAERFESDTLWRVMGEE